MLTSLVLLALGQGTQPPAAPPMPSAPVSRITPPVVLEDGPTPPRQIAGSISDADYPAPAIRAEESGTTRFTARIGVDGVPTDCRVTQSSGSATLDTTTCDLVKQRFRFEPARDEAGKPTISEVKRSVTWRLPEGPSIDLAGIVPALTFAPGELRVTFGGTADERPRCAVDAVGAAFQARLERECFGYQRAAAAELMKEPYRIIILQRLQPRGMAAAPSAPVVGAKLMGSMSATVEVDGEGKVTQCSPVDTSLPLPSEAVQQRHICDGLFYGFPLFLPVAGKGPHQAAMQLEMYATEQAPGAPAT